MAIITIWAHHVDYSPDLVVLILKFNFIRLHINFKKMVWDCNFNLDVVFELTAIVSAFAVIPHNVKDCDPQLRLQFKTYLYALFQLKIKKHLYFKP